MFPIRDSIPSRGAPMITWAIVSANVAVFIYQLTLSPYELEQFIQIYGIIPRRFLNPAWAAAAGFPPHHFFPLLSSAFLHGGWFHIIVNLWTLLIFGNNVEDRLGHIRFLLFYLVCAALSGVVHLAVHPFSTIPVIGASGAIAGVLGAYLMLFPFARILCVVPIFIYPLILPIPAFIYLLFWFVSQLFSGALSLTAPGRAGGIAFWAHIGGFLAGVYFIRRFTRRSMLQITSPRRR